jgi:hypothetical protein
MVPSAELEDSPAAAWAHGYTRREAVRALGAFCRRRVVNLGYGQELLELFQHGGSSVDGSASLLDPRGSLAARPRWLPR